MNTTLTMVVSLSKAIVVFVAIVFIVFGRRPRVLAAAA